MLSCLSTKEEMKELREEVEFLAGKGDVSIPAALEMIQIILLHDIWEELKAVTRGQKNEEY